MAAGLIQTIVWNLDLMCPSRKSSPSTSQSGMESTDSPIQPSLFQAALVNTPATSLTDSSEPVQTVSERSWYTISEITEHLQGILEADPLLGRALTVKGELSNVKRSSRGHCYFTLKDESASINGVIWAGVSKRLSFQLQDGLEVFATGQVEVYGPNGSYSLVCQSLDPVGVGALQLAFEQIKAKLSAEGLFDPGLKQPLPMFPKRVGIITSNTGAVIHDMLRVIRRKNPLVDVLLCPVPVQGEGAAQAIAGAVSRLNNSSLNLDVLLLARGGGSFEDLFCFSEEAVVRAVATSHVPIITGIGHEPDFGLADAAADYSASTPTAAAEAAVPDIDQWQAWSVEVQHLLKNSLQHQVLLAEQRFDRLATGFVDGINLRLTQAQQQCTLATDQLTGAISQTLKHYDTRLSGWAEALDALSPLKTLARGYAVVCTPDQHVITQPNQVQVGDPLRLKVEGGTIPCQVTNDPIA